MSTISPTSYKLAFLQFCRNSSSRSGIPPNQQATTEVWWVESEVLIVFCRLLLAIDRAIKRAIADIKIGIHVDLNSSIEPLINSTISSAEPNIIPIFYKGFKRLRQKVSNNVSNNFDRFQVPSATWAKLSPSQIQFKPSLTTQKS
jgi:hypothetical protein